MAKATPSRNYADTGEEVMDKFVRFLLYKLDAALEPNVELRVPLTAAEMAVIQRLLTDNAVTLSSVKRGDFGEFAKGVAEDFPVDETGKVSFQ